MAAVGTPALKGVVMHEFTKRGSWPSENVGVMVVFAIVFAVAVVVAGIYIQKALQRRKDRKPVL